MTDSRVTTGLHYYAWWFPGSPVRVQLALDVVFRLKEHLLQGGSKMSQEGLLFGKATDGTTEVADFQPTPGRVAEAAAALAKGGGQRLLVGYYRIESGDTLRLTESDLALVQACFPQPYQVSLVIQTTGFGPPNASFFFHDKSGKMSTFPLMEFPFDVGVLAGEESDRLRRSQEIALPVPAFASVPAPKPQPAPAEPRRARRGLLMTCLFAAGLLAFGAGLSIDRTMLEKWWPALAHVASPPVPAPAQESPAPLSAASPALGLRAKRTNGDVEISWQRQSPEVAAAISGLLLIQDGSVTRDITLDAAQVRNSTIVYAPTSNHVTIKLAITTKARTLIESVMLLLPPNEAAIMDPAASIAKAAAFPPKPAPAAVNPDTLPTMIVQPVLSPPDTTADSPSAAYHPAEPLRRVIPSLPAEVVKAMPNPRTIEVQLAIDSTGRVIEAEGIPQRGISSTTLRKFIAAARSWTFVPARRGADTVSSEYVLQFHFAP